MEEGGTSGRIDWSDQTSILSTRPPDESPTFITFFFFKRMVQRIARIQFRVLYESCVPLGSRLILLTLAIMTEKPRKVQALQLPLMRGRNLSHIPQQGETYFSQYFRSKFGAWRISFRRLSAGRQGLVCSISFTYSVILQRNIQYFHWGIVRVYIYSKIRSRWGFSAYNPGIAYQQSWRKGKYLRHLGITA